MPTWTIYFSFLGMAVLMCLPRQRRLISPLLGLLWLFASDAMMSSTLASQGLNFEGRHLTEWLVDIDPRNPRARQQAAVAAIRQIGTNAVPQLVGEFGMKGRSFGGAINNLTSKIGWKAPRFETPADHHRRAMIGLMALGAHGLEAAPALIKSCSSPTLESDAKETLAALGPDIIPLLIPLASDTNWMIRATAFELLAAIGPGSDPEPVLAVMTNGLQSADFRDRDMAATLARSYGCLFPETLPQVEALLQDATNCPSAAFGLMGYGTAGKLALVSGLLSTGKMERIFCLASLTPVVKSTRPRWGGIVSSPLWDFHELRSAANLRSMRLAWQIYQQSGGGKPESTNNLAVQRNLETNVTVFAQMFSNDLDQVFQTLSDSEDEKLRHYIAVLRNMMTGTK